jgi:hypothetical protein
LNPLDAGDGAQIPAWKKEDDDFVLTFRRPGSAGDITYVAEQSETTAPGSWVALPNSSSPPDYTFYAAPSTKRLFLRLRVIAP